MPCQMIPPSSIETNSHAGGLILGTSFSPRNAAAFLPVSPAPFSRLFLDSGLGFLQMSPFLVAPPIHLQTPPSPSHPQTPEDDGTDGFYWPNFWRSSTDFGAPPPSKTSMHNLFFVYPFFLPKSSPSANSVFVGYPKFGFFPSRTSRPRRIRRYHWSHLFFPFAPLCLIYGLPTRRASHPSTGNPSPINLHKRLALRSHAPSVPSLP